MTDDKGQTRHPFPGSRPVTDDGRLLYLCTQIGNNITHEFILDGQSLGKIDLVTAMRMYDEIVK